MCYFTHNHFSSCRRTDIFNPLQVTRQFSTRLMTQILPRSYFFSAYYKKKSKRGKERQASILLMVVEKNIMGGYSSIDWIVFHLLHTLSPFIRFFSFAIYSCFIDGHVSSLIYYLCNLIKNCDALYPRLIFMRLAAAFIYLAILYFMHMHVLERLCKSMCLVFNMVRLSMETQLQYVHDKSPHCWETDSINIPFSFLLLYKITYGHCLLIHETHDKPLFYITLYLYLYRRLFI